MFGFAGLIPGIKHRTRRDHDSDNKGSPLGWIRTFLRTGGFPAHQPFSQSSQICNDVVGGQYANDDVNDSIPARPSTSMEKDVETQSTALGKVDSAIMDVSTTSPWLYCTDAD